ncbi:N-acetyltransferase [Photobacterium gaetbulicola]|uniref:GCN5-related N-acetyltransferase n=1 Tax=Photobacterium gaetbulicola Gung47 TaxID=658445 RepID=A0A0C5W1F3_9GAMM|nr:N-acetyltransferase [Photobacterium gaetbulicola]AJR05161.1 GCN5-related N-acetyltransferase [Photobacterium gaetbulicola Gung47]PSU06815.1 N-acetyltransferase [Photobacterium gaetbulicola]
MYYGIYDNSQCEAIIQLFTQTFSDSEGSNEGAAIGKLVEDLLNTTDSSDLFVFVAAKEDKLVGSILFTRLKFETDKAAFLLAPVAVSTQSQGKGIGQALIRYGLETLKQRGVEIAFTYGDPNYYSRVGFERITEQEFKAPLPLSFPHGWQAQSLTEQPLEAIAGSSSCVTAFNAPGLW